MIDRIEDLDQAIEFVLEKATANNRAHIMAATMSQEDHDKHADALSHHASAILHLREHPEVQKIHKAMAAIAPTRQFINKPLKFDRKTVPQIGVEDLNMNHDFMKSRTDHEAWVNKFNQHLKNIHAAIHGDDKNVTDDPENPGKTKPDPKQASVPYQQLMSHSNRFLAHMSAMLEWHNLQKKGEGAHHQFSGHVAGPELEDNHSDSKYRSHSTPSATDRTKFRTQSLTKAGGARWHPGSPEMTTLDEAAGHPSAGKMKELYPFHEIKVNGEPLKLKKFKEGESPDEIHDQDYATNLTRDHMVKTPDGKVDRAMGGYHGNKSANQNMNEMSRVGVFKKNDEDGVSAYFPNTTVAHIVLAKNLIEVLNPYAAMTDEEFGDYVVVSMAKSLGQSEQAAIIAEAAIRMEKAQKQSKGRQSRSDFRITEGEHRRGVEDVLAGKVHPLPLTDGGQRTQKEGEKRTEVQDIEMMAGQKMKRSPFAVPKEVFTDDTYSKIDPEKYKEYVHGEMNEQDHRNQLATYQQVIRHNPEAQKRHKQYVDMHREQVRSGLGRATQGEEGGAPVTEHRMSLREAGQALAQGKITPQEFAEINSKGATARAQNVGRKASDAEMTDDERKIKEADPSYQPKRSSAAGKVQESSEKDLTDIAHGKIPGHMLADKGDFGVDEEHGDAQAADLIGKRGQDGDDSARGGGVTQSPSPIQLMNDHPGFKSYLKMKEHLLGHYKNPAVRKYMEEKLLAHENNPNLDVAKLAATFHFLHRSRTQAERTAAGNKKLLGDIANSEKAPHEQEAASMEGGDEPAGTKSALTPEAMMTPEQNARLSEARTARDANASAPTPPPADPNRTVGLKTADPEYKKKLMAEIQARENAKKPVSAAK